MTWIVIVSAALFALVVFRRPLKKLCGLCLRSGLWLGGLWLAKGILPMVGIHLGVNLLNGLVLGVLGLPGLGLLLMTQWLLR